MTAIPNGLLETFKLIDMVGEGRTGALFNVEHLKSGERGVLKVLHTQITSMAVDRMRCVRDLKKLEAIDSPRLAVPSSSGEMDGQVWLFRRWVEGETLAAQIAAGATFDEAQTRRIVGEIAEALEALHRVGLVHRDLKPSHVICSPSAGATVIDAVLAAPIQLESGPAVHGTPGYVAPEAIAGKLVSARADLYALGCILHELVVGRPVYEGATVAALLAAHADPSEPEIAPSPLAPLLKQLLSKDPGTRPFSARRVLRMVQAREAAKSSRFPKLGARTMLGVASIPVPAVTAQELRKRETRPARPQREEEAAQEASTGPVDQPAASLSLDERAKRLMSAVTEPPDDMEDRTQAVSMEELQNQQLMSAVETAPPSEPPEEDRTQAVRLEDIIEEVSSGGRRVPTMPPPRVVSDRPPPPDPVADTAAMQQPRAAADLPPTPSPILQTGEYGPPKKKRMSWWPPLAAALLLVPILLWFAGPCTGDPEPPTEAAAPEQQPKQAEAIPPVEAFEPPPREAPAAEAQPAVPEPAAEEPTVEEPTAAVEASEEPPEEEEAKVEKKRSKAEAARARRARRKARTAKKRAKPVPPAPSADEVAFESAREDARTAFRAGRYSDAEKAYISASKLRPRNTGVWAGLGAARLHQRKGKPAVEAYEKALALSPNNANLWVAKGKAQEQAGDRKGAKASFKKALAIDPGNKHAKAALK